MNNFIFDMCILSLLSYKNQNYINFCINHDITAFINEKTFNDITLFEYIQTKCIIKKLKKVPILYVNPETDIQMINVEYDDIITFAFRGTDSFIDSKINLDFLQTDFLEMNENCRIHKGFYSGFRSIIKIIDDKTKFCTKVYLTGHSLGGAYAVLTSLYLAQKGIKVKCITFGSPKVGNNQISELIQKYNIDMLRIVNDMDPVPMLPFWKTYQHSDAVMWINNDQVYNIKRYIPYSNYINKLFLSLFGSKKNIIDDHRAARYLFQISKLKND